MDDRVEGAERVGAVDSRDRIIGSLGGPEPGPLLLCIAGLHGNEPAGVEAAVRVMKALDGRAERLHGDFTAIAGNLKALKRGVRFVAEDLNRIWTPDRVAAARDAIRNGRSGEPANDSSSESREQMALLTALSDAIAAARGPVYLLDLHTTSAPSTPFVTLGDSLDNRALANRFPLPIVLGLEEQIGGSLLDHLDHEGLIGIGIESGQHEDPASVDAHEAALWVALASLGIVAADQIPEYSTYRQKLTEAGRDLPGVMEVRYRQVIGGGDGFQMKSGFRNFDRIRAGQRVGSNRHGTIESPESGRILMPLYQAQGDDGFFVVRRVRPVWLRVSAVVRRLRFEVLAPLLPGVRRVPGRPDALSLSPWARDGAITGVLHLMGFTRRVEGDETWMLRSGRQE